MPKSPLQAVIWLSRILQKKKKRTQKNRPGGWIGKVKRQKTKQEGLQDSERVTLPENEQFAPENGWLEY